LCVFVYFSGSQPGGGKGGLGNFPLGGKFGHFRGDLDFEKFMQFVEGF